MQLLTLVSFTHSLNIYQVPALHHAQCQALSIERGTDSTGSGVNRRADKRTFDATVTKSVTGACERVDCQEWEVFSPSKGTWIKV